MTGAAAGEIPDPLAFAGDALAARGALIEVLDEGRLAVLPASLSHELGVPESCTLAVDATRAPAGAIACAIGSPLLERLAEAARASVPFAALASAADAPRPAQARSLAERFALRNAVFEIDGASAVDTHYLVAWLAWRAEADDRYDGVLALALNAGDGAEPEPAIVAGLTPDGVAHGLTLGLLPPPAPDRAILELLARRAQGAARTAVAAAQAAVARRHARDHRRIEEYFAALARDARAPKRRIDADAIALKLEHLVRERDVKLRDLAARYALRVSLEPVAFVSLAMPAVVVHLRVRRRKREGRIAVRLPAAAGSLDRLTCAACGGTTARPAVCDDALHLLCEQCVPQAQGRPECGACRG